jgi:membrane protein involved in colicin uptake
VGGNRTNGQYSAEHLADANIQRTILEGGDVNGAIQGYETAKVEAAQRAAAEAARQAAEEAARQADEAARQAAEAARQAALRQSAAQAATHVPGNAEQLSQATRAGETLDAAQDFTRARAPLAAALHALAPTNNYLSAIGDVAIDGFTYSAADRPNADCPEDAEPDCKP